MDGFTKENKGQMQSAPVAEDGSACAENATTAMGRDDLRAQELAAVAEARRDPAAFTTLYQHYLLPIYRYFYRRVGNAPDAEDLTGATFSKALASLANYSGRGSFAAWLFGIARHTLIDHQRGRRSERDIDDVAAQLLDPGPQPDDQLLRSERLALLDGLVRALPDDQREVVLLRLFAELSTREAAEVMGRSEAATKMLLHRAVTNLRARYTEEAQR